MRGRVGRKSFQRRGEVFSRGGCCFVGGARRAARKHKSHGQHRSVLVHQGTGPIGFRGRSPASRCPDHLWPRRPYFPHLVQRRRKPPSGVLSTSQWCPTLSLHIRARIMTTPLRECVAQPTSNYVPETCHWVLREPSSLTASSIGIYSLSSVEPVGIGLGIAACTKCQRRRGQRAEEGPECRSHDAPGGEAAVVGRATSAQPPGQGLPGAAVPAPVV